MDTHPDDDINLEDYIAPDFDLTPQETTPPPSHFHRYEGATLGALTKIKTFDDRIPRGVGAAYLIATKAQVIGMSGLTDAQWTAKFGTATEIPAPTEVPEPELPATPSADERATYTVEMKAFQAARPRTERYHTIKEGIKRHIAKVYPQEAKRLMNEYGIFPPHLTIRELWANVKSTVVTEHKIEEEATEIMYEIQNLKMTHEDGGAGYFNTMNDKRAALQYINCPITYQQLTTYAKNAMRNMPAFEPNTVAHMLNNLANTERDYLAGLADDAARNTANVARTKFERFAQNVAKELATSTLASAKPGTASNKPDASRTTTYATDSPNTDTTRQTPTVSSNTKHETSPSPSLSTTSASSTDARRTSNTSWRHFVKTTRSPSTPTPHSTSESTSIGTTPNAHFAAPSQVMSRKPSKNSSTNYQNSCATPPPKRHNAYTASACSSHTSTSPTNSPTKK